MKKEERHFELTKNGIKKRLGDDRKYATVKDDVAKRKCLRCDNMFSSKNRYNRVCYHCAHLEDYRYLGDHYSLK